VNDVEHVYAAFEQAFKRQCVTTSGAQVNLRHAGEGHPPLLLLHGYPQTHAMWHRVAPKLAQRFHVVCPDLRGYGDSSKPPDKPNHSNYANRAMANDMVEVMASLGHASFGVAGHDRGARVAQRMALDHPEKVSKACVMDIAPTLHMYDHTDQAFATGYYHWFFLIQPDGLPERLIGADPAYYLKEKLRRASAPGTRFTAEALAEYVRCFQNPDTIHATCEDYRASATIDLEHDRIDRDRGAQVRCPLLVLWGKKGFVERCYDVLSVWRAYAQCVEGRVLDCGHFLPEERSDEVAEALLAFFDDA